jgi:hypothetical protein
MALTHGHADKTLRTAYHEAVELGHELSKKMNEDPSRRTRGHGEEESDEGSDAERSGNDDSGDGSSDDGGYRQSSKSSRGSITRAAAKQLDKLLAQSDSATSAPDGVDGKYKKLFEMDFMKKAAEQQREKVQIPRCYHSIPSPY